MNPAMPRILSGIKPTGRLHIGNYFGMMRPAIDWQDKGDALYFIADYHALTTLRNPAALREYSRQVAIDFLACGLDPGKATLFRQSDVPQVTEITWLLSTLTPMPMLENAHAYKAHLSGGVIPNLGLFSYPVLMAVDILIYDSDIVPVGKDQKQHVEITRDLAVKFNATFGEVFKLPEPSILPDVDTIPGLDGQKMSKSYDNTIPLFAPREEMRKLIASIVTDSRLPGEVKEAEGSHVFQLYQAFASAEETAQMRQAFAEGIGWGDAKQKLFERIDAEVAPMRERYQALIDKPGEIESILRDGARRLREKYATPFLAELRQAVGLRDLSYRSEAQDKSLQKSTPPSFKQYRDTDNRFYFKFLDGNGVLLVQSSGFDSPKEAGQLIAVLKRADQADAMETPEINLLVPVQEVLVALRQLREADA